MCDVMVRCVFVVCYFLERASPRYVGFPDLCRSVTMALQVDGLLECWLRVASGTFDTCNTDRAVAA